MKKTGYINDNRVFLVDDGEKHWVVAKLADEALKLVGKDTCGYNTVKEYLDDMGPVCCKVVRWNKKITAKDYDDGTDITNIAREWAKKYDGIFCSTLW